MTDTREYKFAAKAGANKVGWHNCPLCGTEPVMVPLNGIPVAVHKLVDEKSVQEYKLSGMCQVCQDEVFAHPSGGVQ